ncbi:MAG: Vms1/Ankzf1 family peptidyl-tRNA hydrolase [Ktedonobacteraceae bacterium]
MQHIRDLLRQLAHFDPGDALVLSVYLDMRPHSGSPAIRPSLLVLKDRFRQIEKTLLPRGTALDNFRIDANCVQRYLDEHAGPWLQGVALFACNSHNLFEVIETGVPFEDQVALEPVPDLFQLARLVDEQETAVVALVDTNTTRLFVTRSGFLEEVAGPDDDPFGYRQRNTGGLNHKRYQRHVDNQREEFAREAAAAVEELVIQEGAKQVILAGDAVALPLLHRALSPQLEPLIHEEILRLDIRTPRHEVLREIAPILAQEEEKASHARADRLVEAVQEQGLGVIGLQETRDAFEHGQGEVLVLAEEAALDEQERNDLVRLATLAGAEVDLVRGHAILQQMGSVGALLRYRLRWV